MLFLFLCFSIFCCCCPSRSVPSRFPVCPYLAPLSLCLDANPGPAAQAHLAQPAPAPVIRPRCTSGVRAHAQAPRWCSPWLSPPPVRRTVRRPAPQEPLLLLHGRPCPRPGHPASATVAPFTGVADGWHGPPARTLPRSPARSPRTCPPPQGGQPAQPSWPLPPVLPSGNSGHRAPAPALWQPAGRTVPPVRWTAGTLRSGAPNLPSAARPGGPGPRRGCVAPLRDPSPVRPLARLSRQPLVGAFPLARPAWSNLWGLLGPAWSTARPRSTSRASLQLHLHSLRRVPPQREHLGLPYCRTSSLRVYSYRLRHGCVYPRLIYMLQQLPLF